MHHRFSAPLLLALAGIALQASCSSPGGHDAAGPPLAGPGLTEQKPVEMPGLHNVVAYHDEFWSGSAPEGDEGFETLRRMGVRTIITVDGSEPDVALAHKHGLGYIHLPIGYNGMSDDRRGELAREARDAMKKGPVYVHCHHGKHRSAAAAAVVAVGLGWDTPDAAVERMKVSGTAPAYKGLYACAAAATVMSAAELNAVPANFPEVSPPPGYVRAMVEIDERHDHLKAIEAAGWKVPTDHPDLVPVAEAGRLVDLFRLEVNTEKARTKPADFAEHLTSAQDLAQAIEDGLNSPAPDRAALSAKLKLLGATCKDCHAKYRD
jgi:hypothetical protein